MSGHSQFLGAAGQHYVAYCLSVRGIHAAITLGNVPTVDIAVARHDGAIGLFIQVKTSRWAHRPRRYGRDVCEWHVGASAVGRAAENLWYAFVDLQEDRRPNAEPSRSPRVFLVPSLWVSSFVKEDWKLKMYMLPTEVWPQCLERWDRMSAFFSGDADTVSWCRTIPPAAQDWQVFWHLADPSSLIFNNAFVGKGWVLTASFAAEQVGASIVAPYQVFNKQPEKEAVWERIRHEEAPQAPSRMGSTYLFASEADANKAKELWFPAQPKIKLQVLAFPSSLTTTHRADSTWLNRPQAEWETAARHYWRSEMSPEPMVEVLAHGSLFFPGWERPPFGTMAPDPAG